MERVLLGFGSGWVELGESNLGLLRLRYAGLGSDELNEGGFCWGALALNGIGLAGSGCAQ